MSGSEDPSLAALRALAAGGDGAAVDRELGRLLAEEATPLLWRVIRSQLPDLPTAEQEEVHGDALLRLTVMLQRDSADDACWVGTWRLLAAYRTQHDGSSRYVEAPQTRAAGPRRKAAERTPRRKTRRRR